MTRSVDDLEEPIRTLVRRVARDLLEEGAHAVVLTGSHARGRARPDSDVDLFVVGDGPRERFLTLDGTLFSLHWWTALDARERMARPDTAVMAVEAWRDAVVVEDPLGVAEELRREAADWDWKRIAREADAWVCDELVGWAEYVVKLAGALDQGRDLDAAAIRAQTALKLGGLFATRKRLTASSENGLWEAIADAGGPEWRASLERALASADDVREAAAAAMTLFRLLADDVDDLLDDRQRQVVEHALRRSERYLVSAPS